jgi:uncharacterized membrane protein
MSVETILPQLALWGPSFLHLVFSQRSGLVIPLFLLSFAFAVLVGSYGCQRPSC